MKEKIREIMWDFVAGEVTDSEATQQVLDLLEVVGRSEQLPCEMCGGNINKEDNFTDEKHCENCGWF